MRGAMEFLASRSVVSLTLPTARQVHRSTWICRTCRIQDSFALTGKRTFMSSRLYNVKPEKVQFDTEKSYTQPAAETSQQVPQIEKNHFARIEQESKEKQTKSPWMREGSDEPPVQRMRSAGAMVKGKLLTTPSRMLKLILPLTPRDANDDRKNVEPLALLVHPQQPLSYLERLIQSEIPALFDENNKPRIPQVSFRAHDTTRKDAVASSRDSKEDESGEDLEEGQTGQNEIGEDAASGKNTQPDGKSSYSAERKAAEDLQDEDFIRWSPSTEIGDFIRDAARAKEFAVDIEGTSDSIYVGVPSFKDRTFYLRMRLRSTSRKILQLADIKKECDQLAQRAAQRMARAGFGLLVGWWVSVYYLTFMTDYGWDVMEPVTYLVGLSGLMGGYMWFLYHNREVSYRSAMNLTMSRRQTQLYEQKGFNLAHWERLVEEANRLRREIKMVADEYDVEWDEIRDEHDEKVAKALREERKKEKKGKKEEEDDEDEDDDKDDDKDDGKDNGKK